MNSEDALIELMKCFFKNSEGHLEWSFYEDHSIHDENPQLEKFLKPYFDKANS